MAFDASEDAYIGTLKFPESAPGTAEMKSSQLSELEVVRSTVAEVNAMRSLPLRRSSVGPCETVLVGRTGSVLAATRGVQWQTSVVAVDVRDKDDGGRLGSGRAPCGPAISRRVMGSRQLVCDGKNGKHILSFFMY